MDVEVIFFDSEYEGGRKESITYATDRYNKKTIMDLAKNLNFNPVFCLVGYSKKYVVKAYNGFYNRHVDTHIRYSIPGFKEVRKFNATRDFKGY